MARDAASRILPVCALAITLTSMSCTNGPEPASATREASPSPPVAAPSVRVAPLDAAEATPDRLVDGDFFAIDGFDLSLREGPSGTTVRADFRATARQEAQSFELDYCGPPLVFLSVDGSTVETTLEEGTLRARLHSPLQADDAFSFRFLTVVPRDQSAPRDVAGVAAELFCR